MHRLPEGRAQSSPPGTATGESQGQGLRYQEKIIATILRPKAKRLVEEFQVNLMLSDTDSRRAAFVCLATSQGWTKAKIGRYLGVSRSRIGQKVTKYEQYAKMPDKFPVMAEVMAGAEPPDKQGGLVAYTRQDWNDDDFAVQILNTLAED